MTHAMIHGRLMPIEEARVSVLDRSFLYGDGVFETLRVLHGNPFRWDQHFDRLSAAAAFLGISVPQTSAALREDALALIDRNAAADSVLRVHLSRGVGSRGYSPRNANQPTLVLTIHSGPGQNQGDPVERELIVAPWRIIGEDPLGRFKTANRLLNVMARKAADEAGADEALLLNARGEACTASAANLFWMEQGRLFTPPEQAGVRAGVTREVVMDLAAQAGKPVREEDCTPERLKQADAVFLTQSALGVVTVRSIDGQAVSGSDAVAGWQSAHQRVLEEETSRR